MSHEPLPIVLCCAEEAEVALVAVVDALHQEGFTPEVLPGVERDAELLAAAADRIHGRALFVLCQSDDLDRFQVRRLQGLFSARKGPEHRMITVDVQAMGAMSILPEVRVAAQGGGRVSPSSDDDGRFMRDVVMPSAMAAPGASIPNRPRRRNNVIREPEGITEEALGMLPQDSAMVEPPRKVYPEPDVLIATDPTGETISPYSSLRYDQMFGDGVPRPVPEDFPEPRDSSQDVEIVEPQRRVAWSDRSGPIEVDRVSQRASKADPRADADAAPLPSVSSPIVVEEDAPAEEPEPERRSGRIGLLLLAGAGMAGIVAMAVLHGTAPVGLGPAGGRAVERGLPSTPETPPGNETAVAASAEGDDGGARVHQAASGGAAEGGVAEGRATE
ncbi:MAG: hypothetical protein KDK70_29475, partial [Myxococcales bacterium]|nr:hypothetical protein [Myxococcales bacterium]